MPRLIASDEIFEVSPPGLWRNLKVMLGLGPLDDMNWRILHKPSGTEFMLTQEEYDELEKLSEDLPIQGANARQNAQKTLLKQIKKYWQKRNS